MQLIDEGVACLPEDISQRALAHGTCAGRGGFAAIVRVPDFEAWLRGQAASQQGWDASALLAVLGGKEVVVKAQHIYDEDKGLNSALLSGTCWEALMLHQLHESPYIIEMYGFEVSAAGGAALVLAAKDHDVLWVGVRGVCRV